MRDLCWLVKTGVSLKPVKHDTKVYIRLKYLPPATKLGQGNVFTHVCHSVHRGVCHTHTHPWAEPPWPDTPWAGTPTGQAPPWADPSWAGNPHPPPPGGVHAEIRSTSGRYASLLSYWNAILLKI